MGTEEDALSRASRNLITKMKMAEMNNSSMKKMTKDKTSTLTVNLVTMAKIKDYPLRVLKKVLN